MARNAVDWYLQRITGGALLILLTAHFWVEHFMTAPLRRGELTYDVVVARVSNPIWQVIDISFLLIALYHGLNGVRNIFLDYGPFRRGTVTTMNAVLVGVGLVWAWLGITAFSRL